MSPTEDALRRAEQAEVADELLATMRHDIRNKLASVRQAGYYLKTRAQTTDVWEKDVRVPRFFGLIDEQLTLIDSALQKHDAFARVHHSDPRDLDARAVVDAAAASSKAGASIDTSAIEPAFVRADEAELVLALRCLLDNAADATPTGTIRVEGRQNQESYVFAVIDEGEGLSPEAFRKFLRPFEGTRADRRGLGLSIARRVASRYAGALALVPQPEGARVELSVGMGARPDGAQEPPAPEQQGATTS